jgi:hypothetical protein
MLAKKIGQDKKFKQYGGESALLLLYKLEAIRNATTNITLLIQTYMCFIVSQNQFFPMQSDFFLFFPMSSVFFKLIQA